ncbi:tyrosine-protein phosphatase [Streptomyces sp. NPDC002088]|uniref:tyrosine-protein phosphatase n=1 Tax=Streptomyces sp. NPDC002088 TaxID=3154665 RepID=UPI00332C104F
MYESLLEAHAPVFGRILTHLTEPDGLPALFHCRHGKDRSECRGSGRSSRPRASTPRTTARCSGPRHAMATVLAGLRARHGSVEGFLTERAGLTADVLVELRTRLTTARPPR